MRRAPDLFVTGAARSGTSLLDKLLSAHPEIEVLSQPLPRLYVAAKRRFLGAPPGAAEPAFPLNDLFGANFRPPSDFTAWLDAARFEPDWLAGVLRAMAGFAGQYVQAGAAPEALAGDAPAALAPFVARYLEALAAGAAVLGCKEAYAEEFVPYFLRSGSRVLIVLRDPRDLAASVFAGTGPDHAGAGLPLLFVLRQWRKSVAFALEHAGDPRLRMLRYEDLVADPDAQMAGIATWLGLAAFPAGLARRRLADRGGGAWASNSSHRPVERVSRASLGTGRALLPGALIRAIETLCAPEMRALGYDSGEPAAAAARDAVLAAASEPCPAPRAALAGEAWGAAALAPERDRLAALEAGRFVPALHLSEPAFRVLARPAAARCRPPVLGGRAAALIHDLARGARPGAFLVPANICAEVVLALARAGRAVDYVDLDPETLAMDAGAALAAVRAVPGRIAGVIHARTYGAMFDASDFFAALRAADPAILIVDDRCACRPKIDPDPPESAGVDAILHSTGYGKYADLGGGGYAFLAPGVACPRHALRFDPDHAAAVAAALRAPEGTTAETVASRWPDWLETRVSFGSWPALRAALAAERHRIDAQKARIDAVYRAAIPRGAWLGEAFNAWRFCIAVPDKAALLEAVFAAGGFASGHYRPAAEVLGGRAAAPVAAALHARVVNLFNDAHITPETARTVAEAVRRHLAGRAARPREDAS